MPDRSESNDGGPLDDVLSAATVLFELDAARAEAWASGLLAEVPEHDDLLEGLRAARDERALAIALALTPMLPGAADVAHQLSLGGSAAPDFAAHVGTAVAVGAWSIDDPHATGASVVVEYEHGDGVRHDVLVEIDGGVAVDLLVSPPGVVEVAQGESDRKLEVDELALADAYDRIRRALLATADAPGTPVTDAFLLNHALVVSRIGLTGLALPALTDATHSRTPRAADPEGDAFALATLAAALDLSSDPPSGVANEIHAAAASLRASSEAGDSDVAALLDEVHVQVTDGVADDALLVRVAGAYVGPGPRVGLSPAAADAIDALEWADWLGAVLPLVRGGPGTDASPEQLVRNINRCPEVTTSIPKRDAPAVASAFGCAMTAWRVSGVLDAEERLTAVGAWVLPRALAAVWAAGSTGS